MAKSNTKNANTLLADRNAAIEVQRTIVNGRGQYAADIKKWLVYEEGRGRFKIDNEADLERMVFKLADKWLAKARRYYKAGDNDAANQYVIAQLKMRDYGKVRSVMSAMRSLPDVLTDLEKFDTSRHMINLKNRTLKLPNKPGVPLKVLDHNHKWKMTKVAGMKYDPSAKCPLWLKFLETTFQDDKDMIRYWQQQHGALLSGLPTQEVLFLFGDGANGKSVNLTLLNRLLGDYAGKLSSSDLALSSDADLNRLVFKMEGKRFVAGSEINEFLRINEAFLKDISGGDVNPSRQLYQEERDVILLCKLWLYGNHKPRIIGQDNGIWRRIRLIPFSNAIPQGEQDPELTNKLVKEGAGILNWMLEGFNMFLEDGLKTVPRVVEEASKQYRANEKYMERFIREILVADPFGSILSADILKVFVIWAAIEGVQTQTKMTTNWLNRELRGRGLSLGKSTGNKTAVIAHKFTGRGLQLFNGQTP